jgi:hypothetical protein
VTIYGKEMKTTRRRRRRNERKQERLYTLGRGLQRENRRKRSKKLGRGEVEWEMKIQRQGGKCRGEETDGMDTGKWMDSERRSMGKSRRNQNRRENHLEIALRKQRGGKEQRRKGVGDRYKTVYLFFWNCCFMFTENVIRKARRENEAFMTIKF